MAGRDVGRSVTLAQLQDAPGVVRGRSRVGLDEAAQEVAGHFVEREEVLADDVERRARAGQPRWPVRLEHAALAPLPRGRSWWCATQASPGPYT